MLRELSAQRGGSFVRHSESEIVRSEVKGGGFCITLRSIRARCYFCVTQDRNLLSVTRPPGFGCRVSIVKFKNSNLSFAFMLFPAVSKLWKGMEDQLISMLIEM